MILPACVANPSLGLNCQFHPDAKNIGIVWRTGSTTSPGSWQDWTLSAANAWNNVQGTNYTGVDGQQPWLDGVNNRSHAEALFVAIEVADDPGRPETLGWTPVRECGYNRGGQFTYNRYTIMQHSNVSAVARWVGIHEFGHIFGMAHDPFNWNEATETGTHAQIPADQCGYASMMYWSIDAYYQCGVNKPTWEDTSALARMYTSVN
jgi:hypothetical protein